MEAKIFIMPFEADKEQFLSEELEAFCRTKRVLHLAPAFFESDGRHWWTVFLSFESLKGIEEAVPAVRKESFTEAEATLFQKLKVWRREKADQQGIPAYLVATDKQFSEMIRRRTTTKTALSEVRGFGRKRLDRYGKDIIQLIRDFYGHAKKNG